MFPMASQYGMARSTSQPSYPNQLVKAPHERTRPYPPSPNHFVTYHRTTSSDSSPSLEPIKREQQERRSGENLFHNPQGPTGYYNTTPGRSSMNLSQASHRHEGQATAPARVRNAPTGQTAELSSQPLYYTAAPSGYRNANASQAEINVVRQTTQPHPRGYHNTYYRHGRQSLAASYSNNPPNTVQDPYQSNMSLSYDSQFNIADAASYPNMMQNSHEHEDLSNQPRYPSPGSNGLPHDPYNPQNLESPPPEDLDHTEDGQIPNIPLHDTDGPDSPDRSKAIPKPVRQVTKTENGRYICTWVGCTEEIKEFGRKCEWSKHMDKHDRPYKCPADGCEKLPGFTYSGGLLRHEREVHGKHGGPRKQLNCPHRTCKRHHGKGFSRQENLNEHLRRVHTEAAGVGGVFDAEITEDESEALNIGGGAKRKRSSNEELYEEIKRVKRENEDLQKHSQAQQMQLQDMMRQIQELQQHQLQINLQNNLRSANLMGNGS